MTLGADPASGKTPRDRKAIAQRHFIEDCIAIAAESAKEAGALGYVARVLVPVRRY